MKVTLSITTLLITLFGLSQTEPKIITTYEVKLVDGIEVFDGLNELDSISEYINEGKIDSLFHYQRGKVIYSRFFHYKNDTLRGANSCVYTYKMNAEPVIKRSQTIYSYYKNTRWISSPYSKIKELTSYGNYGKTILTISKKDSTLSYYNSENNLTKAITKDPKGSFDQIMVRSYNEDGWKIKTAVSNMGHQPMNVSVIYGYTTDDKGNWVMMTSSTVIKRGDSVIKKSKRITKRSLTY